LIDRIWRDNLRRNLDRLEPDLDLFMKHRQRFGAILSVLSEQKTELAVFDLKLLAIETRAKSFPRRDRNLEEEIDQARRKLGTIKKAIGGTVDELEDLEKGRLGQNDDELVKGRICEDLADRRQFWDKILDQERQADETDPADSMNRAIEGRQTIERMFANYVDIVSGLMIRDVWLDEGVCRIADDIIRTYREMAQVKVHSWTILGRNDSDPIELSRMIRLGFPEWTVWALPFTAHEFWHAVMRESVNKQGLVIKDSARQQGIREDLAQLQWKDRLLQDCLADVYATYSMGPAYVAAALLLHLFTHRPRDQRRAEAILRTAFRIKRGEPAVQRQACWDIVDKLADAWYGQLSGAERGGDASTRPEPGTGLPPEIEGWVDALHNTLEKREKLRYREAQWLEVKDEWLPALKEGKPIRLGQLQGYRHVLHAVWQARIEICGEPNAWELTDFLSKEALRVCEQIRRRRNIPSEPPDTDSELGGAA